jgi:hypothetical protein
MSARVVGVVALALALGAGSSQAGKVTDAKAALGGKNTRAAATQASLPPLAQRVDALLHGSDLKPGASMGLANPQGTVQLTVTALADGKMVRLINLTTRATMGEWRLSTTNAREIDAASAVVFQSMGLEPPPHLDNKAAAQKTRAR